MGKGFLSIYKNNNFVNNVNLNTINVNSNITLNAYNNIDYLNVKLKNNDDAPMLLDILDVLKNALLFIMENIKNFYDQNFCRNYS